MSTGDLECMTFDNVFSKTDYDRLEQTLHKLARHEISGWALTGGLAVETHLARRGGRAASRKLHDIDFIVSSFDQIPESMADDFLLRHVHPGDPPGKTLLQCVDAETGVRVDVFRAYGAEMERASSTRLFSVPLRMIALEDLTARAARLSWHLAEGAVVAPKFARDLLRLLEVVSTNEVELAWQEHRRPGNPASFAEAAKEIRRLIETSAELLISPVYSTDATAICERCRDTAALPLADASRILAILGYC
jgi:hypothetical protein